MGGFAVCSPSTWMVGEWDDWEVKVILGNTVNSVLTEATGDQFSKLNQKNRLKEETKDSDILACTARLVSKLST